MIHQPTGVAGIAGMSDSAAITGFIGAALMVLAAGSFSVYAFRNLRRNRLEAHVTFWRYLVLAGVAGALFGLGGAAVLAIGSGWTLPFQIGGHLFLIVFIAFALREVYYNAASVEPAKQGYTAPHIRRIEFLFVGAVVAGSVSVGVVGLARPLQIVAGGGGFLFMVYGVWYGERVESVMRGTPLDTLARHLIPVLLATGFYGLVGLAGAVGIDPVLSRSVGNVFLVIAAAYLASSTIRLRQNL